MIARRALLAAAASVAAARGSAQESGRIYRIGHLGLTERSAQLTRTQTLPELEKLGFVLGRNLVFEARHGAPGDLSGLSRDLLAAQPDVVIAIGAQAVRALTMASSSVPIVMFADDPVALGVAASLARPGGNVTGIANLVVDLQAKRLDLLLEAMPAVRRVGALLKSGSPTTAPLERELALSTTRSGVTLAIAHVETADDFAAAFAHLQAAHVEAVVIGPDPQLFTAIERLVALASQARLALSCEWPDMARAGCLIGYGANQVALRGRLAQYVARIFRGARPGDLPIEQPTLFELVVNQRVARDLGISLPQGLLLRADEVIE